MTVHSEHGASIAHRWLNCPGSVLLTRGMPNKSSEAAEQGTDAHALAEACNRGGQDSEEYIDRKLPAFHYAGRVTPVEPVSAEMAEYVQVFLDECRRVPAPPGRTLVEAQITLESLDPPAPMFGTADYMAYVPETETLRVLDLKYGIRHNVVAEGNPQLRYYALGAMLHIPKAWGNIRQIEAVIVQPRRRNPVRSVMLDPIELIEWSMWLFERAALTLRPDAGIRAGEWCKFCPARGQCPAQAAYMLEAAQHEFDDAVDEIAVVDPPSRIQVGNRLLTPAELGELWAKLPLVKQTIADVEAAVHATIEGGAHVPGVKRVPTRPTTRWRDPEAAEGMLSMDIGLPDEAIYVPREIVSFAKARDALRDMIHAERLASHAGGKRPTKKDAEAAARERLADLVFTSSSGHNLVPDDDDRLAAPVATAAVDFADVTQENN